MNYFCPKLQHIIISPSGTRHTAYMRNVPQQRNARHVWLRSLFCLLFFDPLKNGNQPFYTWTLFHPDHKNMFREMLAMNAFLIFISNERVLLLEENAIKHLLHTTCNVHIAHSRHSHSWQWKRFTVTNLRYLVRFEWEYICSFRCFFFTLWFQFPWSIVSVLFVLCTRYTQTKCCTVKMTCVQGIAGIIYKTICRNKKSRKDEDTF